MNLQLLITLLEQLVHDEQKVSKLMNIKKTEKNIGSS